MTTQEALEILRKAGEQASGNVVRKAAEEIIHQAFTFPQVSLRKGEFGVEDPKLQALAFNEELLRKADDVYIVASILGKNPMETKLWQSYSNEMSELRKAMDTLTTGEGKDWIPTGFSRDLIEKVRLQLKVATLHEWIPCPTKSYTLPVQGADATAYLVPESSTEAGEKADESTPGTSSLTFTAKKLGARIIYSTEVDEDSIVPILPWVKKSIVQALANAVETATINGDDSGAHQDSDVVSAKDARKAFKGYRKLATQTVDIGTFNLSALRNMRKKMGKYGVNPSELAWIAGISGYNQMASITEVKTIDQYGPNATILKGELAKLDAIPVIVSEFVREDLNALGVHDGVTTTKTVIALVNRNSFLYGDRRKVTLKTKEEIEEDQGKLVATQRLDFKPSQEVQADGTTTAPISVIGYNLTT